MSCEVMLNLKLFVKAYFSYNTLSHKEYLWSLLVLLNIEVWTYKYSICNKQQGNQCRHFKVINNLVDASLKFSNDKNYFLSTWTLDIMSTALYRATAHTIHTTTMLHTSNNRLVTTSPSILVMWLCDTSRSFNFCNDSRRSSRSIELWAKFSVCSLFNLSRFSITWK